MDSFRTHTGEIVTGERLHAARKAVGDWWEANAYAIRKEDLYASHVTEGRKEENLRKGVEFAESIRKGEASGFTTWQRINDQLTGECVAFLP